MEPSYRLQSEKKRIINPPFGIECDKPGKPPCPRIAFPITSKVRGEATTTVEDPTATAVLDIRFVSEPPRPTQPFIIAPDLNDILDPDVPDIFRREKTAPSKPFGFTDEPRPTQPFIIAPTVDDILDPKVPDFLRREKTETRPTQPFIIAPDVNQVLDPDFLDTL